MDKVFTVLRSVDDWFEVVGVFDNKKDAVKHTEQLASECNDAFYTMEVVKAFTHVEEDQ